MRLLYQEGGTDIEVRCALALEPSLCMSIDLWLDLIERELELLEVVKRGTGSCPGLVGTSGAIWPHHARR